MGHTITVGKNHPKSDKTINKASPPISIYPNIWIILFHPQTISPTWNKSSNPEQAKQRRIMGTLKDAELTQVSSSWI